MIFLSLIFININYVHNLAYNTIWPFNLIITSYTHLFGLTFPLIVELPLFQMVCPFPPCSQVQSWQCSGLEIAKLSHLLRTDGQKGGEAPLEAFLYVKIMNIAQTPCIVFTLKNVMKEVWNEGSPCYIAEFEFQ